MSTKWAIPVATMKDTFRQRKKKDNRWNDSVTPDIMYHCTKCDTVYKKATYLYRQYRNDCVEERFPKGVIPFYGKEKRDCIECSK